MLDFLKPCMTHVLPYPSPYRIICAKKTNRRPLIVPENQIRNGGSRHHECFPMDTLNIIVVFTTDLSRVQNPMPVSQSTADLL